MGAIAWWYYSIGILLLYRGNNPWQQAGFRVKRGQKGILKNLKKPVDKPGSLWYHIWALERGHEKSREEKAENRNLSGERKRPKKTWKKCLTNEIECGKIIKRSREGHKKVNQTRERRTLKIKQRDERRTRDFWEFRLEELQETEPKKSVKKKLDASKWALKRL